MTEVPGQKPIKWISRQVRRAFERKMAKAKRLTHTIKRSVNRYPVKAQKGGPSKLLIHRNRAHRSDKYDYFRRTPL
jgi:uncharacterized protein YllA (UPF0747 family)